jgi:hypothetical protein
MRKHVYRIGDEVRILNARWIERVGYPLIWTDLIEEVENDPKTLDALSALGFFTKRSLFDGKPKINLQFLRAVAMMHVEQRGFGGNERAIIYEKHEYPLRKVTDSFLTIRTASDIDYTGFKMEIIGKRVAKTGTYYPPSGGYDEYSGEYDYQDGGLMNEKTHIILKTVRGEIEACNVEPW